MTPDSETKLQAIFRAVFELPADAAVTGTRSGVTKGWDSLATVSLVAAIESEFGLSLDADEMLRVNSYSATVELLEELGA